MRAPLIAVVIVALTIPASRRIVAFQQTPSTSAPVGQAPAGPAGDQPPAARGRGGRGAPIPPRIVVFSAEPTTIRPGESATLRWAVENPGAMSINHGVGIVTPRGIREVKPTATTTYTLTVGAVNGPVTKSVTVTVPGTAPVSDSGEDPTGILEQPAPRVAGGKPDLTGVYNFAPPAGARGAGAGRGARGAGGPAAGGPQLRPGAEKFRVVRGPDDTGATSDCLPLAPPNAFGVPYPFQIVQTPALVIILHEYPNTFRIIPTDGRKHPVDSDPKWLGDPVGRWEGDTFVVDSVGFNDKTEVQGFRHTEDLHIVERFRRPSYGTLEYEVTIEDPNVFAAPWMLPPRQFGLRPELTKIDEFVCENNRDYRQLFGKSAPK